MQKIFFPSFFSFLVKFSELYRGSGRVELTRCDEVVWGEKCHHTSDILFEWPYVYIVILLSYYFILSEKDLRNLVTILPLTFKLSGKF